MDNYCNFFFFFQELEILHRTSIRSVFQIGGIRVHARWWEANKYNHCLLFKWCHLNGVLNEWVLTTNNALTNCFAAFKCVLLLQCVTYLTYLLGSSAVL